jgi:hypothetical protein
MLATFTCLEAGESALALPPDWITDRSQFCPMVADPSSPISSSSSASSSMRLFLCSISFKADAIDASEPLH